MTDATIITSLYLVTVVQVALQLWTVLYAYRLTKLTGRFTAWTLIISAFTLLTVRNVVSLAILLASPIDLAQLIDQIGVGTTFISSAINIGATLLLLLGVRGLFGAFQGQAKSQTPHAT